MSDDPDWKVKYWQHAVEARCENAIHLKMEQSKVPYTEAKRLLHKWIEDDLGIAMVRLNVQQCHTIINLLHKKRLV